MLPLADCGKLRSVAAAPPPAAPARSLLASPIRSGLAFPEAPSALDRKSLARAAATTTEAQSAQREHRGISWGSSRAVRCPHPRHDWLAAARSDSIKCPSSVLPPWSLSLCGCCDRRHVRPRWRSVWHPVKPWPRTSGRQHQSARCSRRESCTALVLSIREEHAASEGQARRPRVGRAPLSVAGRVAQRPARYPYPIVPVPVPVPVPGPERTAGTGTGTGTGTGSTGSSLPPSTSRSLLRIE